jgi:prepilin-type processing-associated H-X9-DG protein
MVIAIVAILAALLLPAISGGQAKGKRVACANNLRQLGIGVQLYCADTAGRLPENAPQTNLASGPLWVSGNMKIPAQSTNELLLRNGSLFPYANNPGVYHCAADLSQTSGTLRTRSYSMNGWIGSRYMETYSQGGFRTFLRDSELNAVSPGNLWMILDEHQDSIDDGWFLVTMDDSHPFANLPATRHDNGYNLNFADGHVEMYRLQSSPLERSAKYSPTSPDWLRLKQVTTTR